MRWLQFALLLCLAGASADKITTMEEGCFPSVPIESLSWQPGTRPNIFTSIAFGCPGEIAAWNFFAGRKGTFFAAVWRIHASNRIELIGKNMIVVKEQGAQTYMVPGHLRIRARAGDVIGIHYAENDKSVVMCEDDVHGKSVKYGSMLSETLTAKWTYDEDLPVGKVFKTMTKRPSKRMPALKPIYNKQRLRLDGGLKPNEGRAMFFANGEWGTICGTQYQNWPKLFCAELGYDHVEEVKAAKSSYVGEGTGTVTFPSPDCKVNGLFMEECTPGATCDHEDDIFVSCSHGVKLEGGKTEREGRALAFENEKWGTICDDSPDATNNKWAIAFCHELGFDHVAKVSKAKGEYVGKGSGKISYKNPECEADRPQHASDCFKKGTDCTHNQDTFIKCNAGVRLSGGANSAEGIAMVYKNGKWGTVCMSNIMRDRYPAVFCQQLGYDKVIEVSFASKAYTGAGTGRIVDMNPECGPEDAANVHNCGHPVNATCDHNKDLFIKCGHKDQCKNNPCQNGAVCLSMENDYSCECKPGFTGPNCEEDIDECLSGPCLHDGTCVDRVNGYECRCSEEYSGSICQHVAITKDPIAIRSVAHRAMAVFVDTTHATDADRTVSLSNQESTIFTIEDSADGIPGAVTIKIKSIVDSGSLYLNVDGDVLKASHGVHTSFFAGQTENKNYVLKSVNDPDQVLVYEDNKFVLRSGNMSDPEFLKTAEIFFSDLDGENTLVMYSQSFFEGSSFLLTGDDSDFRNHGFDDKLQSFEIKGRFWWQLFEHRDYSGKSVIAQPGRYDSSWVETHLGKRIVSSARKIESTDGMTAWTEDGFSGNHITLSHSHQSIKSVLSGVNCVEVVGPSSWELYSEANFKGKKCVAEPGRYDAAWLQQFLGEGSVVSARKVEINLPMCSESSGQQNLKGKSGKEHDVFVVHKEDGSVWLRFGQGNMGDTWNHVKESSRSFQQTFFSNAESEAILDFEIVGWEVDSDVEFTMMRDNSWSPSRIAVTYLGSRTTDILSFPSSFSDKTALVFSADKEHITCTGRVNKEGKPEQNNCGENGLPSYGTNSNKLIIVGVDAQPNGVGAFAHNSENSRNAFTWSGSYYYVYAKLADCSASTGCFKRATDVDYAFGHATAKTDERPASFYFGQMGDDIDACEAACKNERDCAAYTLYEDDYSQVAFAGGCYGVGTAQSSDGVTVDGALSGKAMNCDSFIPEYMEDDMWTRNVTGCPCQFDTSRRDCACCYDGACQCGYKHRYQCTLCGFNDRCGTPFLSTSNNEFLFEYTDQLLTSKGRHYEIPDMCVIGCTLDVRGSGSAANEIAAHMTDEGDRRVLSCVASGLDTSTDITVRASGAPINMEGVRVNRINLYAFGGEGEMVQLKLKVDKSACSSAGVAVDRRYVGCFKLDTEHFLNVNYTRDHPRVTSTHMTKALCLQTCHARGYDYALLRLGTTCECSDTTPSMGEAADCDMYCSGDYQEVCGGTDAQSVYMTVLSQAYSEVAATAPGECTSIGGKSVSTFDIPVTGDVCKALTGADTSGSEIVGCTMDWCSVKAVTRGGLFLAAPGSCGANKKAEVSLSTTGADCLAMGGAPSFSQTSWGPCTLDICVADSARSTLFSVVHEYVCPAYRRAAKIDLQLAAGICRKIGGNVHDANIPDANVTECNGFVACVTHKDTMGDQMYTFPHNNEVIFVGGAHEYTVPEMCVTECQFTYKASSDDLSIATATMMGANGAEAGLTCGGNVENSETAESLTFADRATGVKVSGIVLSALNTSFVMEGLKLRVDKNGCKDDEDLIVLYDQPNFGGRPKVIKTEVNDLDSVDFNNKATSFKIYGNQMWELFENKEYKGRSAVLSAGEYYDTSVLPFGDDELSSVHRVGSLDTNMDQTRKDVSNAKDLVCFRRTPKSNAVFGLPPNGPESENRPRTFYFGNFGSSIDQCERACRAEPQCAAFTLFSPVAEDASIRGFRGQCYGRSFRDEIDTYQEDVMSGYVANCAEEDTITLYTGKEFAGHHVMIIEDIVNVTMSDGPQSAFVTGQDTWRVLTISDGHIHTYTLSPGEYSDVTAIFVGDIFQVSKMHPNTQLYKAQHNTIDMAPVALNQIERVVTKVRTRISTGTNTTTTTEECNTTQIAEIFFVIDASGSVREHNYVKVLDFVNNIIDSFEIGEDKVRVGVIVFSSYSYLNITLGQFNVKEDLQAVVSSLPYYAKTTWTHEAIEQLRLQGLAPELVRDDVSKLAIVITDGASRYADRTADESHLCRDAGIAMTAVGVGEAVYSELQSIAGDASRVFNVTDFDDLPQLISSIEKTTCTAVNTGDVIYNETEHVSITVQGNDTSYFIWEHEDFKRKPVALGMESGVILNVQIFASSSLHGFEAELGRLNHNSGWMTTLGNHTIDHEWIEIDLGRILPIHGVATQGHAYMESWVTKYHIAISLDGIHFVTLKESNSSIDLTFIGNSDQNSIVYHCLHRLFGTEIKARIIRFIAVEWHMNISMRIELYGFREAGDINLIDALRKDVWTRNVTGCPCYFNPSRKDCACCEDGGCQCPNSDRHQCVQCGYPHNCGTPSLRNPINNIDGWTTTMSGCRCPFDRLRTDCACCQSWGCQCGVQNKNQCVNCGHPEHCGLKEHIFGPNSYCKPLTCPKKINTIWEHPPTGLAPGEGNPGHNAIKEVNSTSVHTDATVL